MGVYMNLKEIYINDAVKRLCDGSKQVDKLNIKSENGILIVAFKTDNTSRQKSILKEGELWRKNKRSPFIKNGGFG